MLDFTIVMMTGMAAYLARFEGTIPGYYFHQLVILVPVLAIARIATNWAFGVYRMVWRYVGLVEALRFAQACATVSAVVVAARLLLGGLEARIIVPYSIIIMEGALSFLGMAGARFIPRIRREGTRVDVGTPTLLIGAGQGGLAIVKEANRHPELGIRPCGFLDDDPQKVGMEIANLRVLGTTRDITRVVGLTGAERVIITSDTFAPKSIGRIMDACNALDTDVQIVRGTYENLGEPRAAGDPEGLVREIRIDDLLSRDPVPPSLSLDDLRAHYGGKRVLVTGAGGSIGAELCRQLAQMGVARLYLAERDETNLFEIERELGELRAPSAWSRPCCSI
jgi:FlaA1/EpsC-like NDP-sugar epimerase